MERISVPAGQANFEVRFRFAQGLEQVCGNHPVVKLKASIAPADGNAGLSREETLDLRALSEGLRWNELPAGRLTLTLLTLDRLPLVLPDTERFLTLQAGDNRVEVSLLHLASLAIHVVDQDGWPVDMPIDIQIDKGTSIREIILGGRPVTVREGERIGSLNIAGPPYGIAFLPAEEFTIVLGEAGLRNGLVIEPMMAAIKLSAGQTSRCEFVAVRASRRKLNPLSPEDLEAIKK